MVNVLTDADCMFVDESSDQFLFEWETDQNLKEPAIITKISINSAYYILVVKTTFMNTQNKPKIVFILGGPGAGKGTQCDIMTTKYGFKHYSTGDLLREFIKTDCEEAKKIKELLADGKLAPSQMVVDIVKREIFKNGPNSQTYLIDGFPRSAENYEAWKRVMGDDVSVKTLIYLGCSFEVLEARLLERAKTSGRTDDNIETIRKRFNTYSEQTKPFLQFYKENVGNANILSGEKPIVEVEGEIRSILENYRLV